MVAEIKVGDSIPSLKLQDGSPFDLVDLSQELATGKGLIVSTPAAFSPDCTDSHVPGYVASDKLKDAGKVFVVAVNDGFVMKAWGKKFDADKSLGIRFVGDPTGEFIQQLGVDWDSTAFFGNRRGKRGAIATEDGKVVKVFFEPDNFGISESAADKFLA